MAASIDNRPEPGNFEGEPQRRIRLRRRRQRKTLQQQLFGLDVMPIPSQRPTRNLRRMELRKEQTLLNSIPQPSRPLLPRQPRLRAAFLSRSPVQPLRPVSENSPRRPLRTTQQTPPFPNSNPQDLRSRNRGYTRSEPTPSVNSRTNPWQVQSKLTSSPSASPKPDSQPPKSSPTTGGRRRRNRDEKRGFQAFKTSFNPEKPRRVEPHASSTTPKVSSSTPEIRRNGKRVRQKAGVPPSPRQTQKTARRLPKRPGHPFVYIIRLLILGIGIGAIAGTLLSALDPATQASVQANDSPKVEVPENSRTPSATPLALSQEILPLKSQLQTLVAENPKLQPGVFIVDLDTGAYIDFNSRSTLAAASTIKLPILVALFQDVDAGKIRLDETLTLQQEMIAAGSGNLQYQKPGTKFTVLDLATKMMVISDNTATNVLIARLGGTEVLSQRFRSWGLTTTVLNNVLPDLEGTNTTSPQELGMLMSMVNQGQLVSLRSRDRILGIMQQNQISTLLPKGLGEGAIIAHKTGNIGEMLADAGLVDMPSGKRYIITVMVKRPFNDPGAENLIHKISQLAYEHFNQPLASPNTTLLPSGRIPSTSSRAIAWNPFY